MRFFRRRPVAAVDESVPDAKESALAEARRATARLRREQEKVERYRAGRPTQDPGSMTTNQWIGGGS
jgi:hypothetical protein